MGTMTTPKPFGLYHILWLVAVIVIGIAMAATRRWWAPKMKKGNNHKWFMVIFASVLVVFEIGKFLVVYERNKTLAANADKLPIMTCGMMMWAIVITAKKTKTTKQLGFDARKEQSKTIDAFNLFLATYALFAGASVMVLPTDVFQKFIFANIQTMVVHGGLAIMGVYMLLSGRAKLNHKTLAGAITIYIGFCITGILINAVGYWIDPNAKLIAMHLSPFQKWQLPIVILFNGTNVPWVIVAMLYMIGVTAISYGIFQICYWLKRLNTLIEKKLNLKPLDINIDNANEVKEELKQIK
jgi:hypothetical protein